MRKILLIFLLLRCLRTQLTTSNGGITLSPTTMSLTPILTTSTTPIPTTLISMATMTTTNALSIDIPTLTSILTNTTPNTTILSSPLPASTTSASTMIPTTSIFTTTTTTTHDNSKTFLVGLIVTEIQQANIGFSITGGVIPLALQQIANLHLLDGADFEFVVNYTDCTEGNAAGLAVYLIKELQVDVIIGPACALAIPPVGILTSYYKTLQIAWGFASAATLTDNSRFPYLTTLVPTFRQLGFCFATLTTMFEWDVVALLYGDSGFNICPTMMSDLMDTLNDPQYNSTNIASIQRLDVNASRAQMVAALLKIKSKARIIAICMPDDRSKRDFLIATTEAGMNDAEYVYVLLDVKGFGFGQLAQGGPGTPTLPSGLTPMWIDTTNKNQDGLDSVAQKASTRFLVIDLNNQGTVNGQTTAQLASQVRSNVLGPPFYCNTTACLQNDQYTGIGSFAPQLYDSFMYYVYCLNASITLDPLNGWRNETVFNVVRSTVAFAGWSGLIEMTPNTTRIPRFYLYGMTPDGQATTRYANFTWSGNGDYMVATPLFVDEASTIWALRGGNRPLATPICGFSGKDCPLTTWQQSGMYICIGVGAAVLLLIVFSILSCYIAREKRRELQRRDAEWRISYISLERADGKGSRMGEKSMNSLRSSRSSKSSHSKFSFGSRNRETDDTAYFLFQGEPIVAYKYKMLPRLTSEDFAEFRMLRKMEHDNVHRFIGICHDHPPMMSIWKFATRGTLEEVISKSSINLDAFFAMSLIRDLVEGLLYIHKSSLGVHGNLCSSTCWIDERWQLKVSGYGCSSLQRGEKVDKWRQLWQAPEVLRSSTIGDATKEADVYAFAIICSEIVTKKGVYDLDNRNEKIEEILYMVKKGGSRAMRPNLEIPEEIELNPALIHLIRDCWSESPESRPTVPTIKTIIRSMAEANGSQQNLMDHVFQMMESYAETLEKEVQDRMSELVEEKKKSDLLLYRMLPRQVADRLKLGQSVEPESFDSVTIFFSDVVQFTNLAAKCTPLQIVNLLNDLYTIFDQIIEQHSVYKVETIGDGYLCVSGLPYRNGIQHVKEIAEMSLDFLRAVKVFRIPHLPSETINLRIGMHSGSCVAGVVGLAMPRYCLFGDTVNTASRMESNGKPGQIHMSCEASNLLERIGGYAIEPRGEVIIKGKGVMETFWLIGKTSSNTILPPKPANQKNPPLQEIETRRPSIESIQSIDSSDY